VHQFPDLIQEAISGCCALLKNRIHTKGLSSAPMPRGGSGRRSAAPSRTRPGRSASRCTWSKPLTADARAARVDPESGSEPSAEQIALEMEFLTLEEVEEIRTTWNSGKSSIRPWHASCAGRRIRSADFTHFTGPMSWNASWAGRLQPAR